MVGLRAFPRAKLQPFTSATYVDFTGGLDYARTVNLADPKFATEALNVRLRHDGGFGSRLGAIRYNTGVSDYSTTTAETLSWWQWADYGYSYIAIGCADGSLWTCQADGTGCGMGVGPGPGGPLRLVQVNNYPYLLGDGIAPILPVYDGSRNAALTQNWNPEAGFSELAPTSGDMPMGRLGAVYHGRMWLADITELGTKYRNRIRWSYPIVGIGRAAGQESWKQAYYVDLDSGADGQTITAMISTGTSLFVAKQHALYQVTGFTVEDVSFNPVTRMVGCCNADAMAQAEGTLYMWDDIAGLQAVTRAPLGGNTPIYDVTSVSPQLQPLLVDGSIPKARSSEVRVGATAGAYGPEVWVVVPWVDGSRRTFVYDVTLKAWTRYNLDLGAFLGTTPANGRSEFVAIHRGGGNGGRILKLNQPGPFDNFGSGYVGFDSQFTTARLHHNRPHERKRHELLRFTASGTGSMNIEVTKNWGDETIASKPVTLSETVDAFILDYSSLVVAPMERITPDAEDTEEPCTHPTGDSLVGSDAVGVQLDVQLPHTSSDAIMFTYRGSSGNEWAVHAMSVFYYMEVGAL